MVKEITSIVIQKRGNSRYPLCLTVGVALVTVMDVNGNG